MGGSEAVRAQKSLVLLLFDCSLVISPFIAPFILLRFAFFVRPLPTRAIFSPLALATKEAFGCRGGRLFGNTKESAEVRRTTVDGDPIEREAVG